MKEKAERVLLAMASSVKESVKAHLRFREHLLISERVLLICAAKPRNRFQTRKLNKKCCQFVCKTFFVIYNADFFSHLASNGALQSLS